jgi:hypothetical protein
MVGEDIATSLPGGQLSAESNKSNPLRTESATMASEPAIQLSGTLADSGAGANVAASPYAKSAQEMSGRRRGHIVEDLAANAQRQEASILTQREGIRPPFRGQAFVNASLFLRR